MVKLAETLEEDFVKAATDYVRYRPDYSAVECAGTVIMRTTEIPQGYVRRKPDSNGLWGVFFDGSYYCGLDTIWDAFRVLQMLADLSEGRRLL